MNNQSQTQHWIKFKKEIADLDRVRNEDFWSTFTELQQLKDYDPS